MSLDRSALEERIQVLEELRRRKSRRMIETLYPDDGPLRRELYPKHLRCFEAGKDHTQRLMLAANRVGKSFGIGAYETTLHLTGLYPDWWNGWTCDKPVMAWAGGDTAKTVRGIAQFILFGTERGTGLIPGDTIERTTPKAGVPDAIDQAWIRHVSGGLSVLTLKSYDQRRESFQGEAVDFVWLDEEPPLDVYTESLMRLMTTDGRILLTFTPLMGISDVVMSFLPDGRMPNE